MNRSDQINELAGALAKAQAEMDPAPKSGVNPAFKRPGEPQGTRYASLPDVIGVARVLAKHGLSFVQPARTTEDGSVTVETVLLHASGQWLSEALTLRAQQNTPQGIGSALTYGRRYGLSSLVGIAADEDDDGNEATRPTQNGNGTPKPAPPSPQRAAPQVDAASSALAEEFSQGIAQAKDAATIGHIIASVAADHKAHKLNDLQAKALKEAIIARRQELGIVSQAAAS